MQTKHLLEYQKELLVETFSQARAYTNVIMIAGYAGAFALWQSQERLTAATSLSVGLLLAISIATFVGWELFAMIQRYKSIAMLRRAVDDPEEFAAEVVKYNANAVRQVRSVEKVWHPVIFVAAGSAGTALLILVSAFCHGLLIEFGGHQASEMIMEVNALSLVLGALIAGLIGVAVHNLQAKRSRSVHRNALVFALAADLRSSVELYTEVIEAWGGHKVVLFDLLDQLEFVRSGFVNDRTYLNLLEDDRIRVRLNRYFRSSYVVLKNLRELQEEYYRLGDDDQRARKSDAIQSKIDQLSVHAVEAAEIADQLTLRNNS